ncbi:DUF1573 domain-containing protein [Cerasicoccus arenae]|uniref:DUF1573 domain-containing protein n=1 Tax=Cerasicoccus arenae TaxID=424488 RepID=A0A8J3D9W6_9BACT|nr:DUF1573 domain-containing protein [Cerasicoccus arenae]MBK1859673.1 DUF1573 domain-containing protein [Cerasicoccus arenae]GHB92966.1 hypothetical protein GCM10007047_05420 [Cerasicoccus arenae]
MKWVTLSLFCLVALGLRAERVVEADADAIEISHDVVVSDTAGALSFETLSIDGGQANFKDKEFVAKFPFTNKSDQTVTILSAKASCGCTVPKLAKTVYAPGESGEIVATFSFGQRTGLQQKTISVVTDSKPPQRTTLRLQVTIPQVISIKPRVLFWDLKDKSEFEAKDFTVVVGEQVEGNVRLAGDAPAGFKGSLEPKKDSSDYTLTVQPLLKDRTRSKFKVEVVDTDGKVIGDTYAFVIIR